MGETILKMTGITKRFPGVVALDNVDLELRGGEVLALVGENGAGKSTLLKIISGAYIKDEGAIEYEGKILDEYTPQQAIDMGISIIYQELDNYVPLSVTENILVNALPEKGKFKRIDWKKAKEIANAAIIKITDEIDVDLPIGEYSAAKQQMVEIAKALNRHMRVLIMDEPTSALNRVETETLLKLIRKIAETGVAIAYISHRMDEIFKVADKIQVMRDGKKVALYEAKETNQTQVITQMVGRELAEMYPHTQAKKGEIILEVKGLTAGVAKNVSLKLHRGEILGLFGLMGAGRTSVARALFGDLAVREGEIFIKGKKAAYDSPDKAIRYGIAYVPSERKTEGLMLIHDVRFNTCISVIDKLMEKCKLNMKKENEISKRWIKKLNIKTPSASTVVESLSGGNQQKVVIGKWLETNPDILILNDPTRGIDVGAKKEIYELMEELCEMGIGIIMISSELQEMLAMSDRMLVMCEGRVAGEVQKEGASQESLMKLAVGAEK
jgi:ABC-type sugar transport system ATPase subunit